MWSVPKIIAAATAGLFVASVVTTGLISNANASLKTELNAERLNAEKLLSEKLSLKKDVDKNRREIDEFKTDVDVLRGTNARMEILLAASRKSLSERQDEIDSLIGANADLASVANEVRGLRKLSADYKKQIAALDDELKAATSGNLAVTEKNNVLAEKISELEMQNKELAANNELLKIMSADSYLVEGAKGNKDKPTLVAGRTDKLVLSFAVPADVSANVSFNIIAPGGNEIEGADINITTKLLDAREDPKLIGAGSGAARLSRTIKMEYDPKGKFARGVYRIEVFNNNNYMGSCQVRLI